MDPQRLLPIAILALATIGVATWSYQRGGVRHRATLDAFSQPLIESPSGSFVAGRAVRDGGWLVDIQGRGLARWTLELPAPDALYWAWGPGDRLYTFEPEAAAMTVHTFDGEQWVSSDYVVDLEADATRDWFCGVATEPPEVPVPPKNMLPLVISDAERQALSPTCPPLPWTWR